MTYFNLFAAKDYCKNSVMSGTFYIYLIQKVPGYVQASANIIAKLSYEDKTSQTKLQRSMS